MRLLRVIIVLVILAVAGLAGYAYLGDMRSAPTEMRVPVQLDLNAAQGSGPAVEAATPASANQATGDPAPETPAPSQAPQADESSLD